MISRHVRVIFHIGQHKTGSKALQSYLALNVSKLKERGVLYPIGKSAKHGITTYQNSHFHCYALARLEAMKTSDEAFAVDQFWTEYRRYCEPFTSLDQGLEFFEAARAKADAHTVLISAEDLFDMQSAHDLPFSRQWVKFAAEKLLRSSLRMGWSPEIVIYLRRQDHLLNAQYAQYIKGSSTNTLGFEAFAQAFEPRLHSLEILRIWESVFGLARIRVRPYEPQSLPGGIVPDFFRHIIGFLPSDDWNDVPSDLEFSNITPSRAYIDLIREFNIRSGRGHRVPPRESILQAAFSDQSKSNEVTDWLPPTARYQLLTAYREDNKEIADKYGMVSGRCFFSESWPEPTDNVLQPPANLTNERVLALMLSVIDYNRDNYYQLRKKAVKKVLSAASVALLVVILLMLEWGLVKFY